jgi:aspartyl-tRNA(Asn)/glutamyl-tRNA(Gln) amidotransferase subunit A
VNPIEKPPSPPEQGQSSVSRRTFLAGGAAVGAAAMPAWLPAGAAAAPRLAREVSRSRTQQPATSGLPSLGSVAAGPTDPADLGLLQAAALLRAGRLSSRELTEACQNRIATRNGPVSFSGSPTTINAWIRLYPEIASTGAANADARLAAARRRHRVAPALCGVPIGLKDLYAVDGLPVTASSKVLAGNIATGNSHAWQRLSADGMVLLGHTHTDEFAFLAVTPQCGNPWDTALITGGSSGGSAAALASRMVPAALGSDTLGSLRIPAAFCGVSSIKPTFGLVSAYGVIPLAWALDHCGPMGRSIGDCSLLLSSLAGEDPNDPSTDIADVPLPRYPTLPRPGPRPLKRLRIGVPTNLGTPDSGPAEIFQRTQSELKALGAEPIELAVPTDPFGTLGPIEFYTDALSYHSQWYPARIDEYKPPAAQMLDLIKSLNLTALDYLSLHRQRAVLQADWKATFAENRLDAVVLLVSNADPPARANPELASPVSNPENSELETFLFSYLGFPVVTVPGGTSTASGLPVGIQIGGPPFTESTLIQLAIDHQAHYPHYEQTPSFP